MAEKVERFETPESQQGSITSVTLNHDSPEYCGSFDPLDIREKDELQNLRNAHYGVVNVLREWRQREQEVAGDRRFTPEGRRDVLERERPTFEKRLEFYETVVENNAKHVQPSRSAPLPAFFASPEARGFKERDLIQRASLARDSRFYLRLRYLARYVTGEEVQAQRGW